VLAKDPEQSERLDVVLATLVEGLRIVAVLLHPWMPSSTDKLLAALGTDDRSFAGASMGAGSVTTVSRLDPLFPKHAEPGRGAAASGQAA
jgi:methionyl-tRNA synthetase